MTWFGPALDADQKDLAAMLDALAADRASLPPGDSDQTTSLVATLAELGVWTLGAAESAGGGGADHVMTSVALERLGRHWPALGWASVQAHAAATILACIPEATDDLEALHRGVGPLAVVEAAADHVDLAWTDGRLRGQVDRVDVASESPGVLVLTGDSSALLVRAPFLGGRPVRVTGLDGALSRSLTIDVDAADVVVLNGVDVDVARRVIRLGTAAVAAGIAGAAASDARDYATQRHQFGGPLTDIPTVRAELNAQQSRTTALLAAVLTGADGPHEAQAVVELACTTAIEVTASALQSHGGYGYLDEYAAGTRLRDAVSLRAAAALRPGSLAAAAHLVGAAVPDHELAQESA